MREKERQTKDKGRRNNPDVLRRKRKRAKGLTFWTTFLKFQVLAKVAKNGR